MNGGVGRVDLRALLVALGAVVVLLLLAVMRDVYAGPSTQEKRCEELRAAANSVAQRHETSDDEGEYLRRAHAAEKACAA